MMKMENMIILESCSVISVEGNIIKGVIKQSFNKNDCYTPVFIDTSVLMSTAKNGIDLRTLKPKTKLFIAGTYKLENHQLYVKAKNIKYSEGSADISSGIFIDLLGFGFVIGGNEYRGEIAENYIREDINKYNKISLSKELIEKIIR